MELQSAVVLIKKISAGESVSYGRTWIAEHDTVIGVIPCGYGDGLPRRLSNNFSVLINGKLYPQIGRICMDQFMVDLGPNTEVNRWDTVTIFGGSTPENAATIAACLDTIPYEITCDINKRVPRVYQ
jgi:alanine racemase